MSPQIQKSQNLVSPKFMFINQDVWYKLLRRLDAVRNGVSICGIYLSTNPNIYFQKSISQNPHNQRNVVKSISQKYLNRSFVVSAIRVTACLFSSVLVLVSGTSC